MEKAMKDLKGQARGYPSKEMPAKYGLDGPGKPAPTFTSTGAVTTPPEVGNDVADPFK